MQSVESSMERKFQGTKKDESSSSMEISSPGTKIPGDESSRERKFHRTGRGNYRRLPKDAEGYRNIPKATESRPENLI